MVTTTYTAAEVHAAVLEKELQVDRVASPFRNLPFSEFQTLVAMTLTPTFIKYLEDQGYRTYLEQLVQTWRKRRVASTE